MHKSKKWLLYCLYMLLATGFFLYYRFPSDTLSSYLLSRLHNEFPACTGTIGGIKPFLPPGLNFSRLEFNWNNSTPLEIAQVEISPEYLALLKRRPAVFISADAYAGTLSGRVDMDRFDTPRMIKANASFEGLMLEKIEGLRSLSKREVSGILEGKLVYKQASTSEPLRASLKFTDLTIELLIPVFDMAAVSFNTVETDLVVNRQQVTITRCVLRGQKVDGSLSGSVTLMTPLEKSTFNLTGTVKIQPAFMTYLKKNFPDGLLPKKKTGGNSFPIRFFGTLDKPGFSLK